MIAEGDPGDEGDAETPEPCGLPDAEEEISETGEDADAQDCCDGASDCLVHRLCKGGAHEFPFDCEAPMFSRNSFLVKIKVAVLDLFRAFDSLKLPLL